MSAPSLEIDYRVRGYDCGYGGPLRILPLMNFLQEAAGEHAAALGIGMEELKAAGKTWMLSRIDLRIDRLPREGEQVRVRTWPSGVERLFAVRDLVLETGTGESLVRAVYAYLVVDVEARKPLRPDRALDRLPVASLGHALEDYRFGVELPAEGFTPSFALQARPRHIDENGHVNNAYLVDWLLDAPAREARGKGKLRGFRVDFLAEVLEDDRLEARWAPASAQATSEALVYAELQRPADGASCARAEIRWTK